MSKKYSIKIGIIGGSGLENPDILHDAEEKKVLTPFGYPSDNLIEGTINGIRCVLLFRHGRKHNITPTNVNYRANLWALKELNCTHVIVSTACGSLKEEIKPGSLVIPDSFIDLTNKRNNTFYDGTVFPNDVYHIPMDETFCSKTRDLIIQSAKEIEIDCHPKGTVVTIEGPRFSTLAESNLFRSWGADLVNMTLATETTLAKEIGLCYASICMATDYDCWHPSECSVNVPEVLKAFKENASKVVKLMIATIDKIVRDDWDETIDKLKVLVETSVQSKK